MWDECQGVSFMSYVKSLRKIKPKPFNFAAQWMGKRMEWVLSYVSLPQTIYLAQSKTHSHWGLFFAKELIYQLTNYQPPPFVYIVSHLHDAPVLTDASLSKSHYSLSNALRTYDKIYVHAHLLVCRPRLWSHGSCYRFSQNHDSLRHDRMDEADKEVRIGDLRR